MELGFGQVEGEGHSRGKDQLDAGRIHRFPTDALRGQPHATDMFPFNRHFLCTDAVGARQGARVCDPTVNKTILPRLCMTFLSERWDHFLLALHASFAAHGCGLQAGFVPGALAMQEG